MSNSLVLYDAKEAEEREEYKFLQEQLAEAGELIAQIESGVMSRAAVEFLDEYECQSRRDD